MNWACKLNVVALGGSLLALKLLFICNSVFLVLVLIGRSQIASPPSLYISQKVVGKIFRVSPQVEHSIGLPTRHPHVRVCPNNYQIFVTVVKGKDCV